MITLNNKTALLGILLLAITSFFCLTNKNKDNQLSLNSYSVSKPVMITGDF